MSTGHGEPADLSHAQQRILLAEEFSPGTVDHSTVTAYELSGPVDAAALRSAVRDVAGRHPVLRTVYGWGDDHRPWQRVLAPEDCPDPCTLLDASADTHPRRVAQDVCERWWADPFDLYAAPPLRVALVRQGPNRHVLCLNVHHIAVDGWSMGLIAEDLGRAYPARLAGAVPSWPTEVPGYTDYVRWERTRLDDWCAEDLPYWRRIRQTTPPPIVWSAGAEPGDDGAAVSPTGADALVGGRGEHVVELAAPEVEAALGRARKLGGLALPLLMGAVAQELGARFETDSLAVGTVFSGRVDERFAAVVGCFVNPVAISLDGLRSRGLAERLAADTRLVLEGLWHGRTPFDELVRRLAVPGRSESWFQVLTLLHDPPGVLSLHDDLDVAPLRIDVPGTESDLVLEAQPVSGGGWVLRGRWRAGVAGREFGPALVEGVAARLVAFGAGPESPDFGPERVRSPAEAGRAAGR